MPIFPATGLLTDLEPIAEDPWSEQDQFRQFHGWPPLRKTLHSGVPRVTDSSHGDPNYSYYIREQFSSSNIVENWACMGGGQLGAAAESWRVALALNTGDGWLGYQVYYGGGIGKAFVTRKYEGGGPADFTVIDTASGGYPDKLGIRINGDAVEIWSQYGSSPWSMESSVDDTSYRGQFYLVYGIEDPSGGGLRFTCFGGGVPNRPQIYRVVREMQKVEGG